ncbi:MAG: hypothetical protein V4582_12485 [Pseudomonadota bacterium]
MAHTAENSRSDFVTGAAPTHTAMASAAALAGPANLSDGSYASALVLYGLNQPYAIADTAAVLAGADPAVLNGAIAISVTGSVAAAADLALAESLTTKVLDASGILALSGSQLDITAVYKAAGSGIAGLGNEALVLSNSAVSASTMLQIDAYTTGLVDVGAANAVVGPASSILMLYNALGVTGLGNEAVTPTDANAVAATVSAIDARTTGVLSLANTGNLVGSVAEIMAVYDEAKAGTVAALSGQVATVTDVTLAAASLLALDATSLGQVRANAATTLTGSIAQLQAAYAANSAGTIAGLGNEALTLSDSAASASALLALRQATGGAINAASVLTLTGTAGELKALYVAPGFSGLGNENVVLTDTSVTAASLNTLDAATSGVVNAASVTSVSGTVAGLQTAYGGNLAGAISGLGNESMIVIDGTVSVAALGQLDAYTSGLVDLSNVGGISGTAINLQFLFTQSGIGGLGHQQLILTDTSLPASVMPTLTALTSNSVDTSAVQVFTGTLDECLHLETYSAMATGLGDENLVLLDTMVVAQTLSNLDLLTTGVIDAATVNAITGPAAHLLAIYAGGAAGQISGLGNEALALTDSSCSAATIIAIKAATSGPLDVANIAYIDGSLAQMQTLCTLNLSGFTHATLVLNDTSASATSLLDLASASLSFIDVSALSQISGTAANVQALYMLNAIQGLGHEDVLLTDSVAAAATLSAIDAATSGTVDASSLQAIVGTAAELNALELNISWGVAGLGNETLSPTDSTLDAGMLLDVAAKTSASVDAGLLTSLTGSLTNIDKVFAAYAAGTITGLGAVAITIAETELTAAQVLALDGYTTGLVNVGSLVAIHGTAAQIEALYQSPGISGLGNESIFLEDSDATAYDLNLVDALDNGMIDASLVTSMSGAMAQLLQAQDAYNAGTLGLSGHEAMVVADPLVQAWQLNTLDAATSGVVNASAATYLIGSMAELQGAYAANAAGAVAGLGDEAVMLNDGPVLASALSTLDARTTGLVDASGAQSVVGSIAQLQAICVAPGVVGMGGRTLVLTDSSATASALNDLDALTVSTVNAASLTSVSGTAAALQQAYTYPGITGLGNETIVLSEAATTATALASLDALSTGTLDAGLVTSINGNAPTIRSEYLSGTISGLGNEALKLIDGALPATTLLDLAHLTTGKIDVSTLTSMSGTAADIASVFAQSGQINGIGNETLVLSDSAITASALQWSDAITTGVVNAASVTSITGPIASVQAVYTFNSNGTISGLGNEAVTITDSSAVAYTLKALDAATSGVVNAFSLASLSGQAADLLLVCGSAGISGLGSKPVTISDFTLAASTLSTLDASTTGVINAAAATALNGSAAQLLSAYAANSSGSISGLGNETITVSGSATIPQLQALNGDTSAQVWYTGATATTAADVFTLDGAGFSGAHSLSYTAGSQAASAWFTNVAGTSLANGDTFTLNGAMDVIGFAAGDALNLTAFNLVGQSSPAQFGATGSKVGDAEFELVRGTLSGTVFTANTAGNALLVVWDGNTAAGSVTEVAVVLTGVTGITLGSGLIF